MGHRATSRKVAGSISDVTVIFNWSNPSGRTVALGSTQPVTETSTKYICWERVVMTMRRADHLTNFMSRFSWNLETSTSRSHVDL
jgi:hypothetical protein